MPNDVDYEIVGEVGDTLYQAGKDPAATMYFPILEGNTGGANFQMLAVRTASEASQFSVPVQKQIASLDSAHVHSCFSKGIAVLIPIREGQGIRRVNVQRPTLCKTNSITGLSYDNRG